MTHQGRTVSFASAGARGFTLVETLLATLIASLVGVASLGILFAAARASTHQAEMRQTNADRRLVAARFSSAVRGSAMVLAETDDLLVLWSADTDADGLVDRAELRALRHDAVESVVLVYEPWVGAGTGDDLELDADFVAIATSGIAEGSLVGRTLAGGVVSWFTDAGEVPQQGRAVRFECVIAGPKGEHGFSRTVALRAEIP